MSQPIVEIRNLAVNYGDFRALHNVTFSISHGDFLAVVGPNGSGKSTLIKTLVGLLKPIEGTIQFNTKSNAIGYLPQKVTGADPRFPATVEEIVASGLLSTKKFPRFYTKDDWSAVDQALNLLNIDNIRHRRIGRLSGGQQQRAYLARALVTHPAILVLDEPTGALDPTSRDCFYETLQEMNVKHNVTIIIVSHDSYEIGQYANQLLFLDRELLYFGSFDNFNNSEMAHYFRHNHSHTEEH